MKKFNQYFFYIFFAFISTFLNIGIQKGMEIIFENILRLEFYTKIFIKNSNISYGLLIQMGTATIVAFIFKYLVDKLIIFKDKTSYFSTKHINQVFFYGIFAVFTTLIFWGTELFFKFMFNFQNSQYIGAIIGLSIGYTIKFLLDRKFVFNKN